MQNQKFQESEWKVAGKSRRRQKKSNSSRRVIQECKQKMPRKYRRNRSSSSDKPRNKPQNKPQNKPWNVINYASVIPANKQKPVSELDDEDKTTQDKPDLSFIPIPRLSFRNALNCRKPVPSYGVWEYNYFKHILDLKDIFSHNIKKLGLDIETDSSYFLDNFGRLIWESSSGEVSPYLDKLDETLENVYFEFDIKRNNL